MLKGARVTFDTFVKSGILDSDSENEQKDVNSNSLLEAELTSYRLTKPEPLSNDPLSYWKMNSASFPHIAQQAVKLLCVPATSLPCERLFSAAGCLVNKKLSKSLDGPPFASSTKCSLLELTIG
jgi:hypothetical protein